jgi:hypothetical protein
MKRRLYTALLEDPKISRWHSNLARGSQVTADVYLRRLGNFCESTKTTPQQLAAMNEEELYNLLLWLRLFDMEVASGAPRSHDSVYGCSAWVAESQVLGV